MNNSSGNSMGQTIKRLRRERDWTQEQLAELIGVSDKAISKWESGAGMPDISQVMPLASVFGVSTDTLFGKAGTNDDAEVEKFIEANTYVGIAERFADGLAALKRYPTNSKLLTYAWTMGLVLFYEYYYAGDTRLGEVAKEVERVSKLAIEYCDDSQTPVLRMQLVNLYSRIDEREKAMEIAETFPTELHLYRGAALASIHNGFGEIDAELVQRAANVTMLTRELTTELSGIADAYTRGGRYADAIAELKPLIALHDSLGIVSTDIDIYTLFACYSSLAKNYVLLGDADGAFDWLTKMTDFAFDAEKANAADSSGAVPFYAHTHLLTVFQSEWFDSLRDDARFAVLLARVE
ncbi:MAG: helix-turn-helix domain-containing protein [Oscillospiraceae bacterium]|jgi:transcriptional regulator with XRE-family HTH domain|nr:helix-turn-helix domain-containing protein [Oscillospiraceae bacterium]